MDQTKKQNEDYVNALNDQIRFLESEISNLKSLLVAKNNEIDTNMHQNATIKAGLEEDIRNLKYDCESLRKELQNLDQEKKLQVDELRLAYNVLENKHIETVRKLEGSLDMLENELKRTRDTLVIKNEECKNHANHRAMQEKDNRSLKNEIENLTAHILQLERLKNKELEELRMKLETSNNF